MNGQLSRQAESKFTVCLSTELKTQSHLRWTVYPTLLRKVRRVRRVVYVTLPDLLITETEMSSGKKSRLFNRVYAQNKVFFLLVRR